MNSQPEMPAEDAPQTNNKKQGENHGRLPASDYKGATKIEIKHSSLTSGDP